MAATKDAEELRKEVEIGHKSSLRTNGLHGFDIISTLSFCLHASFVFTCIHNFPARWLECWRCRRAWWDRIPFDHEPANVANVVENHSCNALQSSEPHPLILHREVHSEAWDNIRVTETLGFFNMNKYYDMIYLHNLLHGMYYRISMVYHPWMLLLVAFFNIE